MSVSEHSGEAKIDDDGDPAPTTPTISINDKTVLESEGSVVFRISLSEATDHDVTVQWATAANPTDPKALASYDYGAAGGTATVPAGQTWVDLPAITIYNDALDEFDEQFRVNLSNPTGATLAEDYGQGTITDDDLPPVILIDNVEVTEGDPSQDVKATFHVSLSAPSGKAIQIIALTGPVLALPSLDYVHKQSCPSGNASHSLAGRTRITANSWGNWTRDHGAGVFAGGSFTEVTSGTRVTDPLGNPSMNKARNDNAAEVVQWTLL